MPASARAGGIRARRLTKDFPGVRALDALDLEIPPGELYGLVGPNGSGKSTLIRVLMGLETPTRGTASVVGAPPGTRPGLVGYMPQDEALYPDLSVMENVSFFAGLYRAAMPRAAKKALTLVHLWEQRSRVVEDLSGGTRRRVSLAIALLHDPRALFLDEPTVGVDPIVRAEFWESFRERAHAGASILITTHQLEEARRCDRVGLLWEGRILREGTPEELMREAGVSALDDAFAVFAKREEEARS